MNMPGNGALDKQEQQMIAELHGDTLKVAEVSHIDESSSRVISAYDGWTTSQVIKKFWRLYLWGLCVTFAGIYVGFTNSIPGSIVGNPGFILQFGTVRNAAGAIALDANHVGLWAAMKFVAQVLTQAISPFTANRFGLRVNLWILTLLKLIAIIVEIVSTTWWHFLIASVFAGMSSGFVGTSVMSYASEIAMPQIRGATLSAYAFSFAFGQLTAAIALEVISRTAPFEFRRAFYCQFAILALWLSVLVCLPESPVWLHKKGKTEKSMRSRKRLIGNPEGYDHEREYQVMAQEIEHSLAEMRKSSQYSWAACFKGTNLRRTLISTIPFSMQNFVGVPLMFNVVYFFSLIGISNAFTANLIISLVLIVGVVTSFFLVDRVGRRPLLIYGGIVMSCCVLAVGGLGFTTVTNSVGGGIIALICIWVAAYSVSCAPIGWLALVENSTPVLRAQTAGIAAVIQSCSGVLFSYTVPLMISAQYAGWGAKIGLLFGGLASLFTVLVWFTVPETKGRSYAELDELFERRIPAWRFKDTKTAVQLAREERDETTPELRA